MEQVVAWVKEAIFDNQFAQGGLVIAVVSFLLHWCKGLPKYIWELFKRLVSCEFEVSEENLVFHNLAIWARTQKSMLRTFKFTVHDDAKHIFPVGSRLFIRRGFRLYTFYISRDKVENAGIEKMFYLTGYLSVFPGKQAYIQGILDEAADVYKQITQTDLTIRISSGWSWKSVDGVPKRHKETVFISGTIKEDLIQDGKIFLASSEWYRSKGIPWRRGYFLWGGTGTGKTTLIKCLATELNLPLYIVQFNKNMSDCQLMELMNSAPTECIMLLEDIDCAIRAVDARGTSNTISPPQEEITLSGLLNAIDGCATQEGRILIMTTNHPSTIDSALLRDGRVDLRLEIPPADADVTYNIFLHFFPGREDLAEAFAEKAAGRPASEIQGHLLKHKDNADAALKAV